MIPHSLLIFEAILFGLVVGSFLNVCILRIPDGKTLGGRSACPKCHTKISWIENIPVFSFLALGGRCRHCRNPISWQYPLVEIITALLSLLTLYHTNFHLSQFLLWFLLFICPLITLSFIDAKLQIIPDVISLPGIILGILVVLISQWPDWKYALLFSGAGILAGGGTLLLLSQLYYLIRKREGMGGGDIKLAAMLGAFLGFKAVVFVFFISSLLALAYAMTSMICGARKNEPVIIPYGPFLSAAALIYYFYGTEIILFYFSFVGIAPPLNP